MVAARRDELVPRSLNQLTCSRPELVALHEELLGSSSAERRRIEGLDAKRVERVRPQPARLVREGPGCRIATRDHHRDEVGQDDADNAVQEALQRQRPGGRLEPACVKPAL